MAETPSSDSFIKYKIDVYIGGFILHKNLQRVWLKLFSASEICAWKSEEKPSSRMEKNVNNQQTSHPLLMMYWLVMYCFVLYCIVFWFDGGGHCCPMHCDLFKIYCTPPNLGITRTWICRLNFAQRPIFSGLEVL